MAHLTNAVDGCGGDYHKPGEPSSADQDDN